MEVRSKYPPICCVLLLPFCLSCKRILSVLFCAYILNSGKSVSISSKEGEDKNHGNIIALLITYFVRYIM